MKAHLEIDGKRVLIMLGDGLTPEARDRAFAAEVVRLLHLMTQ